MIGHSLAHDELPRCFRVDLTSTVCISVASMWASGSWIQSSTAHALCMCRHGSFWFYWSILVRFFTCVPLMICNLHIFCRCWSPARSPLAAAAHIIGGNKALPTAFTSCHKKIIQVSGVKDYRYHDFPHKEFSYFLTIDTRQYELPNYFFKNWGVPAI